MSGTVCAAVAEATTHLAGQRILVTGATGFLGGRTARRLASSCDVLATGRETTKLAGLASTALRTQPLDLASQSAQTVLAELEPTMIVHAAALSSPWGQAEAFERSNVVGTDHILAAARKLRVPVVHISTPAVYMDGTHQLAVPETALLPRRFVNHYVASKRRAELAVMEYASLGDSPVAILRPQALVGAGDTTIAPRFLRVTQRGVFPLVNGGKSQLDLTHVENVVDSIILALDRLLDEAWSGGEVFNITNGEPQSVRDLIALFLEARPVEHDPVRLVNIPGIMLRGLASTAEVAGRLGRFEPPLTRYTVDLLTTSRTLNIEKARSLLHYDPSSRSIADAFVEFFEDTNSS